MSINMGACDCLSYMILVHFTQQMKELKRDFNELKMHGPKMEALVNRQTELLE